MTMLSLKGMKNGLAIILLILVSFSPFCEVFNFASSNIEGHMAGFIYLARSGESEEMHIDKCRQRWYRIYLCLNILKNK